MKCSRCGNNYEDLFVFNNGKWVCRKCLKYKNKQYDFDYLKGSEKYELDFALSLEQLEASKFILGMIKRKQTCVLNAVTGAGKTEILYESLSYCIKNDLKVGIVIPRKDVVIELANRIRIVFKRANIRAIYGGSKDKYGGDIIVLTSHQLYKYPQYFDVVIVDEVDAFPLYKNKLLNYFLSKGYRGSAVYMSATIPEDLKAKKYPIFNLKKRYHREKLDVPKINFFFFYLRILRFINDHRNSIIIIYFPTIKLQVLFSKHLKEKHYIINSKVDDRKDLLEALHQEKSAIILSTLVLERGITFANCNVVVYRADHSLFNRASLVQISGRVGRKKEYPHGDILFLLRFKSKEVKEAIKLIRGFNE